MAAESAAVDGGSACDGEFCSSFGEDCGVGAGRVVAGIAVARDCGVACLCDVNVAVGRCAAREGKGVGFSCGRSEIGGESERRTAQH